MNRTLMDGLKRELIRRVAGALRRGDAVEAISALSYLQWIAEAERIMIRFGPQLKLWIAADDLTELSEADHPQISDAMAASLPKGD
ncbi:hypothetical protein [Sulfobacillus harzensis]|uniref:Uncharacterized protein n=1 Tax=Sulfobacillus harzensis TaxID=2729629 RepID=A0A7Y0L1T4_9FIRM|nr:hypothetical protein [Sulfobacillus harzensis]NMP21732.1 hypothetical protein [Sulfobacillus harzensis]